MALLHSWTFTADPENVQCAVHGGENVIEQSYSVQYGGSPDRITSDLLHGIYWSKQLVKVGDDHVAGSDTGERADTYVSGVTGAAQGNTRAYRIQALLRTAGNEFNPTNGTNWNDYISSFHDSAGDWPGANLKLGVWAGDTGDAQITNDPLVGPGGYGAGDLLIHLWGGDAYGAVTRYNQQTFVFFPAGQWEGKVIDIALRVYWSANTFDAGSQYFANWNNGHPTDYTQSGWVELQYRLGTPTNGDVSWGAWQWFNPPGWQNHSEPYRNYRPTLMWTMTAYWKWPNYRNGPGDGDSTVRYANPRIGETFTDLGAPEPTGPPPQGPAVRNFNGLSDYIRTAVGACNAGYGTFVALIERGANGTWDALIAPHNAAGTAQAWFELDTSNRLCWGKDASTWVVSPTITVTAADSWAVVAASKASGTATPRFHKYRCSTGVWTHENGAATVGDSGLPGTDGTIRFGQWESTDWFAGNIAWAAFFANRVLSDVTLETFTSLRNVIAAGPSALWRFNQPAVGDGIRDFMGGGADQTAISGTAASTDTIENFDDGFPAKIPQAVLAVG